jgi:hypothetical protein
LPSKSMSTMSIVAAIALVCSKVLHSVPTMVRKDAPATVTATMIQ